MDQLQKNEILASAKINRVKKIPIVESPYAPTEQNVIWLKDGVMYAFNGTEWEELYSSGGGSDEAFKTPIELPLELPVDEEGSMNSRNYRLSFEGGSYDAIESFPIYVIGHYSNGYTLLGTIDGSYISRNVESSETIEDGESTEYDAGSRFVVNYQEDTYNIYLTVAKGQYKDDGELLDYDGVVCNYTLSSGYQDFSDWPLSVVVDVEYNTTKYPEREAEPAVEA